MKTCSWCGKEYPDEVTACQIDGQPLVVAVQEPQQPRRPEIKVGGGQLNSDSFGSVIFPRQIGRASFALRYILFMLMIWLGALLLAVGVRMQPGVASLTTLSFSALFLLFTLFYFIRNILVARLRDIGIHNLYGLLMFVPIANLVFLLLLLCVPKGGLKK